MTWPEEREKGDWDLATISPEDNLNSNKNIWIYGLAGPIVNGCLWSNGDLSACSR